MFSIMFLLYFPFKKAHVFTYVDGLFTFVAEFYICDHFFTYVGGFTFVGISTFDGLTHVSGVKGPIHVDTRVCSDPLMTGFWQ